MDSSNLITERVNYDEVTSVDLSSTPQGFQISVSTDRLEVRFFVQEDWRAQDALDALDAKLISSIDTERLGAVWIGAAVRIRVKNTQIGESRRDRR